MLVKLRGNTTTSTATVFAEIKVPSVVNPKTSKGPSFTPGAGQNVSLRV